MANKIKLGRGTKARIETVKNNLDNYEIVYATDTDEIGVKKPDGEVAYFPNTNKQVDYNDLSNKPITVVATPEMTEKVGLNANNELVVKGSKIEMLLSDYMVGPSQFVINNFENFDYIIFTYLIQYISGSIIFNTKTYSDNHNVFQFNSGDNDIIMIVEVNALSSTMFIDIDPNDIGDGFINIEGVIL